MKNYDKKKKPHCTRETYVMRLADTLWLICKGVRSTFMNEF